MVAKVVFRRLTRPAFWSLIAGMNNAKFALVIAETHKETATFAVSESWRNFLQNIQRNVPTVKTSERIAENVWLIHLYSELPILTKLIGSLSDFSIKLHILFLNEPPSWITYPPDAKQADEV